MSVLAPVAFTSNESPLIESQNKNIPLHKINVDGPYLDIKIDVNMTGTHCDTRNITVFKGPCLQSFTLYEMRSGRII